MIKLGHRILIKQLSNLHANHLAIQTVGPSTQDLVIYFDFEESFSLESPECTNIWEKFEDFSSPTGLSFSGWVGFFGYEFLGSQFGVSLKAPRDLDLPPLWFGRPQSIIRLESENTIIESTDEGREREIKKILGQTIIPSALANPQNPPTCNLNFKEYESIFKKAREAILDGETYQIKISQRFDAPTRLNPLAAFGKLHKSNPAPEAFLLQTPSFAIVSCSPETIIQKEGRKITTRPIGGTYQRKDSSFDGSVIERFLQDPKEVAEHNMLVDLERNDLSTICEQGTVEIRKFREVESYSHLHHLVSTITGRLKKGISLRNIVQAMLPGGSITGCPKVRTMQWIDQLEPCFRGPYTGSFGSIADNGDIQLNLIIRAMLILGDHCYTQAGGGIVVDSTPEYEFKENQTKAQALLDLLK